MNIDLAKRLKDKGFPEQTRVALELNLRRYVPLANNPQMISFPFLQELIEQINILCPREWILMPSQMTPDKELEYQAIKGSPEGYWEEIGYGTEPDIALGELWILLTK